MLAAFWSLLAIAGSASAYANPGPCTGNCLAHDPGFYQRKSDGKYFRFSTGGGITVTSADHLQGPWTYDGYVLPDGASVTTVGGNSSNLWAPDVHYDDGKYYLYYVVSGLGSRNSSIGVAVSDTMEVGSWTDHGAIGVETNSSSPYNAIDPNWITIGDKAYLNYGSYWQGLAQVEMKDSLSKLSSSPITNTEHNSTASVHFQEAAFEFEHDGYYYLFFSSGKAGSYDTNFPAPGNEYKIMVCRSETGTGDFVDKNGVACTKNGGSIVLQTHGDVYAPGGQGVFNDTKLGPVLYYHYANRTGSLAVKDFQFGYNKLSWTGGWPSV